MKALKLFFASLILFTLACGQLTSATTIPPQPVEATEPLAAELPATEIIATLDATEAPAATQPAVAEVVTYGEIARAHVETITGQFGARWSGTQEEADTAHYIEEEFAKMGYEPDVNSFERMGWEDDETQVAFESANVIVVKEGASAQVMVVGAHYDSSDEGLGADDNASGVGVMLELAQQLADVSTPYTIHFVAFGAEEAGLLGSVDYVADLSADEIKNTIGFVNLDSVIAGDMTYVYCKESKPELRDWILTWAGENDFALQTIPNVDLSDEGYGTADYDSFQQVGIPFAYFEATNGTLGDKDGYTQVDPQYGDDGAIIHTQYDTLEYIDKTFPGRVDAHLNDIIHILYALLTEY